MRTPSRNEVLRYGTMAALTAGVGMTAGSSVSAWMLDYHNLLGGPVFTYDWMQVYAPWDLAVWSYKWGRSVPELTWGWFSVLAPFAFAGLVAHTRSIASAAGKPKTISENDGWGTETELRQAGLISRSGFGKLGGLILGMLPNGKLISTPGKEHGIVVGPSGSGKTASTVLPDVLSWLGSIVVSDPKRENYAMAGDYRATLGPSFFFDPTHEDSAHFNPLVSEVRWGTHFEQGDVENLIRILSDSRGLPLQTDASRFYDDSACGLLAAISISYQESNPDELSFGHILRKMPVFTTEILPAMLSSRKSFVRGAAVDYSAWKPERQAEVVGVINKILHVFHDELVHRCTSGEPDFTCAEIFNSDRPMSVFVQIRRSQARRLAPVVSLIESLIVQCSLDDTNRLADGTRKKHRVLLVCEEFANQGRKDVIAKNMLVLRGHWVTIVVVTQTVGDLKGIYGSNQTILANCEWAIFAGSLDANEQKIVSENCGTKLVVEQTVSMERKLFHNPMESRVSTKVVSKPVIDAAGVRALPKDKQIVVMLGKKHAFLADRPFWFRHPMLKDMAHNLEEVEGAVQSEYILAKHQARVTP